MSEEKRGKIRKVLFFDSEGERVAEHSQQLPEDAFKSYNQGLQEPPYPLEQLIFLAEQHPIHCAALEQKAADVVGTGWAWEKVTEDSDGDDAERDKLEEWFSGLVDERDDDTMHEILLAAWNDLETVGHACIEVARAPDGTVKHLYHMPAHTVRFGRDGVRVCQMRAEKRRWFKRWVPKDERGVNKITGRVVENAKSLGDKKANEVIVIKRKARRSSWYGIPTYVSALGWITLSLAARDDNIIFFNNRREPRWAVILTNLEDDPELEEALKQAFRVDLKSPHRNLIIPVEGPGQVEFKQLSDLKSVDMSFEKLQARSDVSILLAHKTPPERLGMTNVGPLGGDSTIASSRVYKEGVIQTSQALLAARINRFIAAESDLPTDRWRWTPEELDLTEEGADLDWAVSAFQAGIVTLNEARRKVGMPELEDDDERGDMYITELANFAAQGNDEDERIRELLNEGGDEDEDVGVVE
jgi:PBSX family phage portal protein